MVAWTLVIGYGKQKTNKLEIIERIGMTEPVFFIDGVKSDRTEFSKMDAEDIEGISILKDGAAKKYGYEEEAENGVFIITTRKAQKNWMTESQRI